MKKLMFLLVFLALGISSAWAQKTFSGKVIGPDGLGLPGVSVVEKANPINGVATNIDGEWSLTVPSGNSLLEFTAIGMKTVELAATDAGTVNMVSDAQLIDEIIVTGYGTRKKNELTGSIVQVNAEEIADIPVASVDQALQGKVSGLTITGSSGTPGSVQNIRIRGLSSITAGNQPLYVIDGVPIVNADIGGTDAASSLTSLSSLNVDDIKSMTVLKDASATSAYGARGANGVIVITTKSGSKGKTTFNFGASMGFSNDAVEGRKTLSGEQVIELGYEALVNAGYYNTVEEARADYNWPLDQWGFDETKDQGEDWNEIIKNENAPQQTYNLSATGGSETSRFYASLGYYNTEATVIGSDFERISGAFSYDKDFTDKLSFSTKFNASNAEQNGILETSAYFASPRTAKYFINPLAGRAYTEDGEINRNIATNIKNPLYIMENDIDNVNFSRLMNNSSLQYRFNDNLKIKTNISIDYLIRDRKEYDNRIYGDGDKTNGSGYQENYQNRNLVWQNSVDYRLRISENNKIDFKGLIEYQKNDTKYLWAAGEEFATDGLTNLSTAGKPTDAKAETYDWSSVSYMAMANYGHANKYFLDLTYRYEGSSRFPTDDRFGHFWSVGGAWNLHEEDFMENTRDVINNLKLRASYGVNGNSNINLNTYQAFFSFNADYAGGGAAYPSQFGNKNLTWEKNALLDVGFDLGLFDDRLTATFSYFKRRTYDLLLEVELSRTTGHTVQNQNVGEMENSGVELGLNFDIFRGNDFNWSLGGNFSTVKNEVTQLAKDANGEAIEIISGTRRTIEGKAAFSWYMREYAGVNPDTGVAQWYLNDGTDGLTENYSEAERVFVGGSALPKYTGGINTHFDYKGFFLNASLYFTGGHKVFEEWASYLHQGGGYNLVAFGGVEDLMNRWQKPGDITDVPKFVWGNYNRDAASTSSRFLYDGDYMRLKDITFGYNLPSSFLSNTFINGVKVYVKGTNLLTWVKDDRLKHDPETGINGFIGLTTPPVKTLTFGLNVKF